MLQLVLDSPRFLYLGSIWNPENIRERKKNVKENDFLKLGSTVENIKENKK